jgi:hypothetical protein
MTEQVKDAWQRILSDDELAAARRKLSIHEIRMIARHAVEAFVETADNKPYDPSGPEVSMLHGWFYDNASPANWHDDGCRSENARDLLNAFARAGFILVPAPKYPEPAKMVKSE